MTVLGTQVTIHLEAIRCCQEDCGVTFAIDQVHVGLLRRSHALFHCPNGHRQHFAGKSTEEQLRAQLVAERESRAYHERRAASLLDDLRVEKISHLSTRGHLGKLRKRIRCGICPHCQRYFAQLHRHIEAKHPATEARS